MNPKHATTFTLEISLGNDGMTRGTHVAQALHELAKRLNEVEKPRPDAARIRDVNGNTVGEWEYK